LPGGAGAVMTLLVPRHTAADAAIPVAENVEQKAVS
jgi:hypothetical protein